MQWEEQSLLLEYMVSDAGVWAVIHRVYCQMTEVWILTWEVQMLINKSQVVLRLKVQTLTFGRESQQLMKNLRSLLSQKLMKQQTLMMGVQAFHAERQMHLGGKTSEEAAWTLGPSAEEQTWVQRLSKKGRVLWQEWRLL